MVNLWLFCFFPLLLCAAGSDSDACEEGTPHLSRNPAARCLLQKQLGVRPADLQAQDQYNDTSEVSLESPARAPLAALQSALTVRAKRAYRATSGRSNLMDSTLTTKGLVDVFESFGGMIGDLAKDFGTTLKDAGLQVGSIIGNAAVLVGDHIVDTAVTTVKALPSSVRNLANSLGGQLVKIGRVVSKVGQAIAKGAVALGGVYLSTAKFAISQGAKLTAEVGNRLADAASKLGEAVTALPALAVGFAKAVWEDLKNLLNCLTQDPAEQLCDTILGDVCDCEKGSKVDVSLSGVTIKCSFSPAGLFSKGFGYTYEGNYEAGDKSSNDRTKMPGKEYEQGNKKTGTLRQNQALKSKKTRAPRGSCETSLELAMEALVQFDPTVEIKLGTNGDTELSIDGTARASVDAYVSGQGSCALAMEKHFPKRPITKIACAGFFCVAIILQMVAEFEVKGTLTGTVEISASADFNVGGSVLVNPSGRADVDFQTPSISHEQGFAIAASSSASTRVGLGPVLTIWPLPGVPVAINPMFHAEARAQGTISYSSPSLLEVEDAQNMIFREVQHLNRTGVAPIIEMCGAAALNLYADVDIQGFGLPKFITAALDSKWVQDAVTEGMLQAASMLWDMIMGKAMCIPGASFAKDTLMSAARGAADIWSGLMPNIGLDFETPSMQLLAPTKLFCETVFKTPGFDGASCATELGCKHAGRAPPPTVEILPAEQVSETIQITGPVQLLQHSATCHHNVQFGDRFMQLGAFRLAHMDDHHFSISNKNGWTSMVWKHDGNESPGPRKDFNVWNDRGTSKSRAILFGFQFVQIGKWRLGAVDDDHFSLAHQNGWTQMVWKSDGNVIKGPRKEEYTTWDRPEGPAQGILYGDGFIQIGNFRIGDIGNDYHLTVIHVGTGQCSMIYEGDGKHSPGPRTDFSHWTRDKHPVPWTCDDVSELAYGSCNLDGIANFGKFGDRFIELGNWRLAAWDDQHKDGKTAQIFDWDGRRSDGPLTELNAWSRSYGFPFGISFGKSFIQIGTHRLGQFDGNHLTLSHLSGWTSVIFRNDGHTIYGPSTNHGLRDRSIGPVEGITYGDRFLQIGNFRIGDVDGWHLTAVHRDGQTMQIWRGDGELHPGPRTSWGQIRDDRYPQWHCSGIQEAFGTCTGILMGDKWIQLGKWRLGCWHDDKHFAITHFEGKTAVVWTHEGKVLTGSGIHSKYNFWSLQPSPGFIKFGDMFMEFGQFRLGTSDSAHLVLEHSSGWQGSIWNYRGEVRDGPIRGNHLWRRPRTEPVGVGFGDRFLQIGNFRVGDVDGKHLSFATVGDDRTNEIIQWNGDHSPGPRNDFTTFGRSLMECKIQDMDAYSQHYLGGT